MKFPIQISGIKLLAARRKCVYSPKCFLLPLPSFLYALEWKCQNAIMLVHQITFSHFSKLLVNANIQRISEDSPGSVHLSLRVHLRAVLGKAHVENLKSSQGLPDEALLG